MTVLANVKQVKETNYLDQVVVAHTLNFST